VDAARGQDAFLIATHWNYFSFLLLCCRSPQLFVVGVLLLLLLLLLFSGGGRNFVRHLKPRIVADGQVNDFIVTHRKAKVKKVLSTDFLIDPLRREGAVESKKQFSSGRFLSAGN
jgi:hypothetical protein